MLKIIAGHKPVGCSVVSQRFSVHCTITDLDRGTYLIVDVGCYLHLRPGKIVLGRPHWLQSAELRVSCRNATSQV